MASSSKNNAGANGDHSAVKEEHKATAAPKNPKPSSGKPVDKSSDSTKKKDVNSTQPVRGIWDETTAFNPRGPIANSYIAPEEELNILRLLGKTGVLYGAVENEIVNGNENTESSTKENIPESTEADSVSPLKLKFPGALGDGSANEAKKELAYMRRLRRKLILRSAKNTLNAPSFNMDGMVSLILRRSTAGFTPLDDVSHLPIIRLPSGDWSKFCIKGMLDGDAVRRLKYVLNVSHIPYEYSFRSKLLGRRLPLRVALEQKERRAANEIIGKEKKDVSEMNGKELAAALVNEIENNDCIRHIKHVPGTASYHVPNIAISKYSGKVLPRYIWRDFNSVPPFKVLLADVCGVPVTDMYPIDYVHLNPEYLDQVNEFLSTVFWPGIDVSESLEWPDYSIIALYNGVVVGCALMIPDGYISYIVVKSGWNNAGIATFMLDFLMKASSGKDLTLHVSANNRALLLYQKLGFKPEEFIVNFYDEFYRNDSRECKNAFFIRLRK